MTSWLGLLSASGKSTVQDDGRLVNTYTRKYLYRTDAPERPTEAQVVAEIGITIGSPIAGDINAICFEAEVTDGPTMTRAPWTALFATYQWSTAAPKPDSDTPDTDPVTRRTLWSIAPTIQSRYVIKDRLGKLILDTAETMSVQTGSTEVPVAANA